ncbi:MAG: peptidylprolyl isomerase, partial [Nanoarchaeota archaeon]|nr:peptidylprolyl isomerase [Nanoarchaeota archaeon]
MAFKAKDFIEIEFTGKTEEGMIFDSNIKEDLKKTDIKAEAKPFIFCLGAGMFLKGAEEFLIGKEKGEYTIELTPDKAFGKRNPSLIQTMPMKIFKENKLNPFPGAVFNFDNRMGRVLTVSGGRVMTDFNNPLAGKNVIYKINVLRKVEDIKEKVDAFTDFLLRKKFNFKVEGTKIIFEAEKGMAQFLVLFKDKFKEVFDLDIEAKEIEGKKEQDKKEIKK